MGISPFGEGGLQAPPPPTWPKARGNPRKSVPGECGEQQRDPDATLLPGRLFGSAA